MGVLECKRCFAKATGSDRKEADDRIDHAIGLRIGRPCSGKQSDLVWHSGETPVATATVLVEEEVQEKPKSKKSKRR
ncbi:hypothetical protein KAR91_03645 [Candidatus Pacearchaeota archaeon]|nr:hypothetical protein [Candidatus Pacearchaeota archaeon]